MDKDVIINLSQRGGKHCRPLIHMLNREVGHDFIAKSGNECLKLSTLLEWIDKQVTCKKDLLKYWNGTCMHNQICMYELIPVDLNRIRKPVLTDRVSSICNIVWEHDRETVKQVTKELALRIIDRVSKGE